jgi:tetraacyldisaccharide 4'-kinase
MRAWLEGVWYGGRRIPFLLRGASWLYAFIARRVAAGHKARGPRLPVPVIVVGNITAGGTGKTPLVIYLVELLRAHGRRPGVVSRGYGGRAREPLRVDAHTDPQLCGDEPALIARRSEVPVAVAADRVAAARLLLDGGEVDVLIADDGLQHYRLCRDVEICVVDGARGLGNGRLLPAGPLREPPQRLDTVDLIVVNGGGWRPPAAVRAPVVDMRLVLADVASLADGTRRALADFAGTPVDAVAAIGHPQRFFAALRQAGLEVLTHAFPDHYHFAPADLQFGDAQRPLLMTEKDAVKCLPFARPGWWAVPAAAEFDADAAAAVQQLLKERGLLEHDWHDR